MLAVVVLASACVSTPRPVGPTTLEGQLPAPQAGAGADAQRAPDAVDGPLRILEPRFAWTHASPTASAYRWSCTVENPSQSPFLVTVVMQLLDAQGRSVATSNQSFRLADEDRFPVEGDGQVGQELARRVAGWRLEYWVRVPPRPIQQD